MKLNMVGYRLMIRPDEIETKSEGGIVLVQDERLERAASQTGVVVSVGDIAWEAFGPNGTGKPWAKVGDKILFSKHAMRLVQHPETKELLGVLQDEDVIAVITEEDNE